MKNEMTITAHVAENTAESWLNRENKVFSSALEETVSNRQVLLLGHASLAFSVLVGSAFLSPVPALCCLGWFGYSLHLCKKGGLS